MVINEHEKSMRNLYTVVVACNRWTHLTTIGAVITRMTLLFKCVCVLYAHVGVGRLSCELKPLKEWKWALAANLMHGVVRREESTIAYMLDKAGISQAYFRRSSIREGDQNSYLYCELSGGRR